MVGSVGVGVGGVPESHGVPLSVNAVGAVLAPDQEARKPPVIFAPVPSAAFQLSFTTVTFVPDWDHLPPQPWLTTWPAGKAKPRLQPFSAAPLLVTVTAPW